ncbi:hypothetical protein K8I85_01930 [bacterium]|nr:hypothetical protein [bacterium]
MTRATLIAFVSFGIIAWSSPGIALEKTTVRADRGSADGWEARASYTITYGNICTGWLWVWDGWDPGDVVGVIFTPGWICQVVATQAYFWTGAPSGYGFTGTLAVRSVLNGCPGPVTYGSIPYLPEDGPVVNVWSGWWYEPSALTFTCGPGVGSPHTIPTDHPAAGPTGPQACALCFPSTRPTHTFYFGTAESPLCPGSPLNDGVCDAEALYWSAAVNCFGAVDETSWGRTKNLYR